jgi:hypothetical protein
MGNPGGTRRHGAVHAGLYIMSFGLQQMGHFAVQPARFCTQSVSAGYNRNQGSEILHRTPTPARYA